MPPKSSSRGRPRRSARVSSRRSTQQTPSAPKSSSPDQSPATEEPFSPPSTTSSASAAAAVIPTATSASPLQSPSLKTTSSSLSASVPGSETPLTSEPLVPKDAALDTPTVAVEATSDDAFLDSAPSQNLQGLGKPNPVSEAEVEAAGVEVIEEDRGQEQDAVVEASCEEVANGSGGGGKTKRIVKKTVKVVKKIVKKVPKRITKGVPDSRVGELGVPEANDDGIVPNSSSNTNSLSDSLNAGVKKEEDVKPCVAVLSSDENSGPDVSVSMEFEQSKQKVDNCEQNVEKERTLKFQGQIEGASMEVDENVDGVAGGIIEVEGKEVRGEAMDAAGDGGKGTEELEVKENPSGALDTAPDCDRDGEQRVDEVEDGGNVAKPEDEMGDGMYYGGEMEAVERRKRRKREIFVGGLDKDAKEEDVRKVFEEVGEVLEVRLVMDGNTGKNKGYAFLLYASAFDAKKALEKFSKVEICGKQCGAVPMEGNDTIYLGSIDKKWKDEDVAKLLQEIGIEGVDTVLVMKNPENKEFNRGFAFVEFETCRDAQVAFKKLQKKDVFGKNSKIKVAWAKSLDEPDEAEMQKVKTVYAEFIPSTWDEEKVKEIFKKFGEIDNVVLAKNLRNAKRKNYAFINYKTREAAITCIESYNHQLQTDEGNQVNVKVSLARPVTRGKQPKQVLKPVSKEIPKERPKPSQGNVILRQIDPRNTGGSTIHHYDIHRPDLRQNIVHREERSSTTSELVQLLREQASWRPPHAGPLNVDYPTAFSGRKRPISTLDTDPVYPDMNRYPHYRLESALPSSSRYGAFPQSGAPTSSAYYPGQPGYASGLPYAGARNYPGSELRDRVHGSSNNAFYRRY